MKPLFVGYISGRVAIKKNSTQRKYSFKHKRTFTMPSDKYLAWENLAVLQLRSQWKNKDAIANKVHIKFTFHFSNYKNEPDLSNCLEGPQDALVKAGILTNDKLVNSYDGTRKVFGKTNAVMIDVYEYKEEG